jgi:hypothetical protein
VKPDIALKARKRTNIAVDDVLEVVSGRKDRLAQVDAIALLAALAAHLHFRFFIVRFT